MDIREVMVELLEREGTKQLIIEHQVVINNEVYDVEEVYDIVSVIDSSDGLDNEESAPLELILKKQ
jgi:hypothetical protein